MNRLQTYADLPVPCFVRNTTSGKLFFFQKKQLFNSLSGRYETILEIYGKGDVLSRWQHSFSAQCDYLEVVEAPDDSIREWVSKAWPYLKKIYCMTQKDIRDIAAYLYARCTFEVLWKNWVSFDDHNAYSLLWEVLGKDNPPQVRNIKLHLRTIQSLTDEEVNILVQHIMPGQRADVINRPMTEFAGRSVVPQFLIYLKPFGRLIIRAEEPFVIEYHEKSPTDQKPTTAAAIAYLQSIGVYVPGTIDEKYVELI